MTKSKDITPERRLYIALDHIRKAEYQTNIVAPNNRELSLYLDNIKRLLLNLLSTLNGDRAP